MCLLLLFFVLVKREGYIPKGAVEFAFGRHFYTFGLFQAPVVGFFAFGRHFSCECLCTFRFFC